MNISRAIILPTLSLGLLAASSQGAIVSVSGQCTLISPPVAASFPTLFGNNAFVWDEQQPATAPFLLADMTVNPSSNSTPTPALIGGTYNSHFLHFTGGSVLTAIGSVTFDAPIVAVFFGDTELDNSDPFYGASGTTYPTGFVGRGISAASIVSISGNVLNFQLQTIPGQLDTEQLRVLTHPVPAPGAAVIAGVGAMMVGGRRRRTV